MPAASPLSDHLDPSPSALADGQTVVIDGRRLVVAVSGRRKRLGLTVERDGSVILRVPPECEVGRAENFVRQSEGWIGAKLRLREEHRPAHPVRAFRDGESFFYLGREYRLLVAEKQGDEGSAPVRLVRGRLMLDAAVAADGRRARRDVVAWYRKAGLRWSRSRLQPWGARMEVPEPDLVVRDVGNRWGTYRRGEGEKGQVALHWAVFQLPSHLVDYVIAHELAHARVSGHGPDYWALLRRALPDCEERKLELDDMGRRLWLGETSALD